MSSRPLSLDPLMVTNEIAVSSSVGKLFFEWGIAGHAHFVLVAGYVLARHDNSERRIGHIEKIPNYGIYCLCG